MAGSSVMMAITSAFGWRLVSRFGRVAVVAAVALEFVVVACYIGAVDVLSREYLVAAFMLLSAVSGVASGLVDAPNRGLTLEYAPIGASGVAAGFLQLSQRLSATISLAAVSGIYLGILGSMPGRYGLAVAVGLGVCLGMLLLALIFAVADARRRGREVGALEQVSSADRARTSPPIGELARRLVLSVPKNICRTIQSDRETWLYDVAATPRSSGEGATAGNDGGRT